MSPKPRRKGKYQAPEKKNRHRRERAAPQPNVVVGELPPRTDETPIAGRVEEAPAAPVMAASVAAQPKARNLQLVSELRQVGILGGSMLVVLVVLALILG